MTVYVTTTGDANTTGQQTYDFYAYCNPFIGTPVLTAATSGVWQADAFAGFFGSTAPPANAIRLPTASVSTSLTTVFQSVRGGV